MKRKIITFLLLFLYCNLPLKADNEFILKGYLIDNLCKNFMINKFKGKGDMKFVKKHKKHCNLLPQCIKNGYSLYSLDGKIYEISEKSNEMIIDFLQKKENTAFVEIKAQLINDKLIVKEIQNIEKIKKE